MIILISYILLNLFIVSADSCSRCFVSLCAWSSLRASLSLWKLFVRAIWGLECMSLLQRGFVWFTFGNTSQPWLEVVGPPGDGNLARKSLPGVPTYCGDREGVLETALGRPWGSTSELSHLGTSEVRFPGFSHCQALSGPRRLCVHWLLRFLLPFSPPALAWGYGAFIGEVDLHDACHSKSRYLVFFFLKQFDWD